MLARYLSLEDWFRKSHFPAGRLSAGFFGFSIRFVALVAAWSRKERLVRLVEIDLLARCFEKLSL